MVTETQDILDVLRPIIGMDEHRPGLAQPPPASATPAEKPIQPPPIEFAPEDVQRAALTALGPASVAVDAITRQTGLNAKAVQIALLELDLAGRIERHGQSLVALKPV